MDKVLLLTQSCGRDRANGRQQAVELTWLQQWGHLIAHEFITGSYDGMPLCGPFHFLVPDDYDAVAYKVHAAMKRAHNMGFEHVFYSDTDTYVCVPNLLASGFQRAPYIGLRCDEGHASGGAGFWVSGPAIQALAEAEPSRGYSDMWVGDKLRQAGIELTHDERYHGQPPFQAFPPDLISVHLVGSVPLMYEFHRNYKDA